jgi:acyl-coenzyme A thioesterase PaaI-like protein
MAREAVLVDEETSSTFHVSWGAIFGGLFVALGVWLLLHALGLAAGLTAIDPNNPRSLKGVGIGTGIWSIIAPLISLFVGGFVSARMAGTIDRPTGALHGAVLWGLTTVAGAALVATALAAVVGAGVRAGGAAIGLAGQGAGQVGQAMNLDFDQALAPINQKLQAQGAPPVSGDELKAATRDVIARGVAQGRIDRETLVGSISANTSLERSDAEQLAGRIQQQFDQSMGKVQHGALQAAETTGKALWGVFFGLLLGLVSSVAGAITGVSRRQRRAVAIPVAPSPVTPQPVRRGPLETSP